MNDLPFEQRSLIVSDMKGVSEVIPQTTLDYRPNLKKIRPDFVVQGNDWKAYSHTAVIGG